MTADRPTAEDPRAEEAAAAASSDEEVVDAEVVEDGDETAAEAKIVEAGAEVVDGGDAATDPKPMAGDPLAEALRERDEYLDLAQRTRADFENFKRRAAAQATEAERRGRAALAQNLLPVIDNLQRALAAAGVDPAASDRVDGLTKGVALVHDELRGALERSGVIAFDPVGTQFDPNLHEAISTAPADGVDAGTVLETLELGYRVDDQVIRAARVVVSD